MLLTTQQRSIYEYALKHLEQRKSELDALIADGQRQLGIGATTEDSALSSDIPRKKTIRKTRTMTPEGKANLIAALKKRWAAYHKAQKKAAK